MGSVIPRDKRRASPIDTAKASRLQPAMAASASSSARHRWASWLTTVTVPTDTPSTTTASLLVSCPDHRLPPCAPGAAGAAVP
jgi:hypothetical protein